MTSPSEGFSFSFFGGLLTQNLMGNDSKMKLCIYIVYINKYLLYHINMINIL